MPSSVESDGKKMNQILMEPQGQNGKRLLGVRGHGSERLSLIGGIYGDAMAAQEISVFVYDKRGTGGSDGEYTQNFELLAADAAKALDTARGMTAGRHRPARFFGGRPGGRSGGGRGGDAGVRRGWSRGSSEQ